jgi:hypothetical protein
MNKLYILILFYLLILLSLNCVDTGDKSKILFGNDWKINIDYAHPEKYLTGGEQSKLNPENEKIIKDNIVITKLDLIGIIKAVLFKDGYFGYFTGGGQYIGKLSINDLFKSRKLSGCHDHALIVAGILRLLGYPVIMVDTADINWAKNYSNNPQAGFIGHVVLEVFVENKWILLDPSGGFFSTVYDHDSPVIKTEFRNNISELYVLFKGLDTNEYGIHSGDDLRDHLINFADNIDKINLNGQKYNYTFCPEYYMSKINTLEKKNKINLTINYKYTGNNIVDKKHQIIIQIDHFQNGMPITNTKIDKSVSTITFKNINVAVDSIYLIGWLDKDSSGFATKGDPTLRQKDENNNPKPIFINKGPVVIDVEFDDSFLWQQD